MFFLELYFTNNLFFLNCILLYVDENQKNNIKVMLLSVKLDVIRKSELNKKMFVVVHYCHVSSLTDFRPQQPPNRATEVSTSRHALNFLHPGHLITNCVHMFLIIHHLSCTLYLEFVCHLFPAKHCLIFILCSAVCISLVFLLILTLLVYLTLYFRFYLFAVFF